MIKYFKRPRIFLFFTALSLIIAFSIFLFPKLNLNKDSVKVGYWAKRFAKENKYILRQSYGSDKVHSEIKSLIDANDYVFIGTIVKINDIKEGRALKKDGTQGDKNAPGFVDLIVEVKVDEIFKGSIKNGDTIKVYQRLGSIFGNIFAAYGDVKEYSENEQYVFFLCNYIGKDGYIVYNSTQGQLFIENTSKTSLNKIQDDDYIINIDKNKFGMFDEKITLGELKKYLNSN